MEMSVLATKLYIPSPRTDAVPRARLIRMLDAGMQGRLTLVCAPAGYGKTTLLAQWIAASGAPVAWLSLDEGDNDASRFLACLAAAVQNVAPHAGSNAPRLLQSPQWPQIEWVLTSLINDLHASASDNMVLVLDDFHRIIAPPVERAVAFLLEHMPRSLHMVLSTRTEPRLPVARMRAQGGLAELRAAHLRFTVDETDQFFRRADRLRLSAEQTAMLESRTEGWIAGLQLAALCVQGSETTDEFVRSFSGEHYAVFDYLIEEVLHRQPAAIQTFLLRTSILERLCGSLCDALIGDGDGGEKSESRENRETGGKDDTGSDDRGGEKGGASMSGQQLLERLERSNLFVVPLDNERRWYRYHHLLADALRRRLQQSGGVERLHVRASEWYERNGLDLEAFGHAVAAGDVDLAARLADGAGMPLIFRGAVVPVLHWLERLDAAERDARPSLGVMYASALLTVGRMSEVEPKLQAAERAIQGGAPDEAARDLLGHVAAIRASLAVSRHEADAIVCEAQRALALLRPDNAPVRAATTWALGYAHQLRGDRRAAKSAYGEALAASRKIGHAIIMMMTMLGLGNIHEDENERAEAADTYGQVLRLVGDQPLPLACEAHMGLARLCYGGNDLDGALRHAEQGIRLARQLENTDRAAAGELFLVRLKLARGDASGAMTLLVRIESHVRLCGYVRLLPEIAAAQAVAYWMRGEPALARQTARRYELPMDELLDEATGRELDRAYIDKLLSVVPAGTEARQAAERLPARFSERELEMLKLIAQGYSNREIGERLFLALSTVKGYNQTLFGKLQVKRRTEAVARAREWGLL